MKNNCRICRIILPGMRSYRVKKTGALFLAGVAGSPGVQNQCLTERGLGSLTPEKACVSLCQGFRCDASDTFEHMRSRHGKELYREARQRCPGTQHMHVVLSIVYVPIYRIRTSLALMETFSVQKAKTKAKKSTSNHTATPATSREIT